jgi:hypothetical protein
VQRWVPGLVGRIFETELGVPRGEMGVRSSRGSEGAMSPGLGRSRGGR